MSTRVSASESPGKGGDSTRSQSRVQRRSPRIACSILAFALVATMAAIWLSRDPLASAQKLFNAGDYRQCLRQVQQHLQQRPEDRRGSLLAARCLTRMGMHAAAEKFYNRAQPDEHEDLRDRAYGLVMVGRSEQAADLYSDIVRRWPDDLQSLKRLAAALMQAQQWKRCHQVAELLLQLSEGRVPGYTVAGIAHHESKNAAAAAQAFEQVLRLDPELTAMPLPQPLFWNNFALDLIALGRMDEARKHLEHALATHQNAGLMELLGLTYEKDGQLDKAKECWLKALEWDPGHIDAMLGLGRLALSRRQWPEAIEILEKAAALAPDSVEPAYQLSQAYRFAGDSSRAAVQAARAEELRRLKPQRGGMGEPVDGPTGDLGEVPPGRNRRP